MIQVGFNTVRDPRTTPLHPVLNSNGTAEKAGGTNPSLASDMMAKLNGSSHQETAKVKKEDPSSDAAPATSEVAVSVSADEKQEQPSSNHATVNLAATVTTNE